MMKLAEDKFGFTKLCDSCNHKSCCTDFSAPMLFPSDLDKLQHIGKSDNNFVEGVMIENKSIKTIKRKTDRKSVV